MTSSIDPPPLACLHSNELLFLYENVHNRQNCKLVPFGKYFCKAVQVLTQKFCDYHVNSDGMFEITKIKWKNFSWGDLLPEDFKYVTLTVNENWNVTIAFRDDTRYIYDSEYAPNQPCTSCFTIQEETKVAPQPLQQKPQLQPQVEVLTDQIIDDLSNKCI